MATPAASGDPRNAVPHLAVKPQLPGIETNLTIYTTKHIYHLLLRSRGRAMQEVEFYYPDELIAAMKDADSAAANAKQEAIDPPGDSNDIVKVAAVDPAQINFAYTVAGPNVPWKPVRAFDDGSHVYVQMPAGMKSSEAPALLINAGSGTRMVNYRVKGNYYVVDRLFSVAILVAGVWPRSGPRDYLLRGRNEVTAMATADLIQEQEEQEQEHLGGGRFNRLLGVVFVLVAMAGGVALWKARRAASRVRSGIDAAISGRVPLEPNTARRSPKSLGVLPRRSRSAFKARLRLCGRMAQAGSTCAVGNRYYSKTGSFGRFSSRIVSSCATASCDAPGGV
jgi:P-type conjugative transfer protein TrbG